MLNIIINVQMMTPIYDNNLKIAEYVRLPDLLLRSVYAYRSLGARVLRVGDWLASAAHTAASLHSSNDALDRYPRPVHFVVLDYL